MVKDGKGCTVGKQVEEPEHSKLAESPCVDLPRSLTMMTIGRHQQNLGLS